jgi:phage terminase large subunit-like protein
MAGENWIYAYHQRIKDGHIVAGRYIRLVLDKLIEGIEKKTFVFDAKAANDAIEWIEEHTFHTEGPLAPGAFKLELWEKAFVSALFGIYDQNGNRHFKEAVLIVARKNGKSILAAAIARYVWMCSGYGARVYNIAPKMEQADIIYNSIWMMTLLDPEYQRLKEELDERDEHNKRIKSNDELPRHRMSDLFIPATNGQVKKIAFSAKKSDGFNPSLTVCDEIAAWQGDAGLKQYEVMKSGMGARPDGLILSVSTSGYVNDSIYDELVKRSTRFLLGDSKETRLLPFLYMIDDLDKWNDINELAKSNPNLGVSVSVDYMLEEIAIAEGSLSKKREFLTKYCNVKQNSSLAWLDTKVVERACGDHLDFENFRSSYAVAGIDLSQTTDLTAAVVLVQKGGEIYAFAKFWIPGERLEEATQRDGLPYQLFIERGLLALSGENYVDYSDCYSWLTEIVERYEILPLMVGYDRYSAQYLVQDLERYGFRTDDVFQGDNLWGVLQEMEGLLKDGKVHIGDNDLLKAHLLNAAIKMNVERGRGRLVKLNPNLHIDGTAALADAFCVRQKWWDELGDRLANEE